MRKVVATAVVLFGFVTVQASAACEHNGIYYEAGAVLCFDGYMQECTVADYWSAIGMCRATDVKPSISERWIPDAQALVAMVPAKTRRPESVEATSN